MSELAIELKSYAMGLVDQYRRSMSRRWGSGEHYHLLVADPAMLPRTPISRML